MIINMDQVTLKNGDKINKSVFERLSQEASKGNYPGSPGDWKVRPQGRPKLADEELVTVAFKIPVSQRDVLDKKAELEGLSRSQYLRRSLQSALD